MTDWPLHGPVLADDWLEKVVTEARFLGMLSCILVFAFFLRIAHINSPSYTLDEILQTYFVQGTWTFFWSSLRFDAVHPPLDYLITRAVESLHPVDWARKLPAILWGLGTVTVVAVFLRRRAGATVALFAALLLAAAPFHVRYSQELRPYSLGVFLLCLSLLALDVFLAQPSWLTLICLYVAALATAYALYFAAVALAVAGVGLLVDEAFSSDLARRRTARRALALSPLFVLALFVAYLPWVPVVLTAARRPSPAAAPPLTVERAARFLSFFAFAPSDGAPLGRKGPLYLIVVGAGLVMAARRRDLRFLAVWLVVTCLIVEVLEQLHPHWYVTRHFLTAGITFPLLAAVSLSWLRHHRRTRQIATILAIVIVTFDLLSLSVYYREGRPDYRSLGKYLTARPHEERIFAENWYTALCVAFYVVGPEYLFRHGHTTPEVFTLEGKALPLAWSWTPGTTAWLVVNGGGTPSTELRSWSRLFPGRQFPRAEGAILRRLDPSLWGEMAKTVPRPKATSR